MFFKGEYTKYDTENSTHIKVYELDKCLQSIKIRNEDNEDTIKRLQEENKRLKDEAYKDSELSSMRKELEHANKEMRRSFVITDEEDKAIQEWHKQHYDNGCRSANYHYRFYPTGLGTVGEIVCSCGEKFEFKNTIG